MNKNIKKFITGVFIAGIVIGVLYFRSNSNVLKQYSGNSQQGENGVVLVDNTANRVGTADIYSNPQTNPGAYNPAITQDNISQNICNHNWSTKSERPSVDYTNNLKREQIRTYGYVDTNMKDFEEDHIIPLELGGAPSDPRNLYPESYYTKVNDITIGAHQKDLVENYLHKQVCSGKLTLRQAQQEIVNDWYAVYLQIKGN